MDTLLEANGLPIAGERIGGVIVLLAQWHEYPDLAHRLMAYSVEFPQPIDRAVHGAAVWRETGELVGMLISTQNQPDSICRALVYPT